MPNLPTQLLPFKKTYIQCRKKENNMDITFIQAVHTKEVVSISSSDVQQKK